MRRYGGPVLLCLVGAAVLRITLLGDLYLRYVQAALRPYLIASGAGLILLGIATAIPRTRTRTPDERGDEFGGGHGDESGGGRRDEHGVEGGHGAESGHGVEGGHGRHAHGPRVAWLLALPALALLLFPPPALGSYSAQREAAQRAAQGVGTFPALSSGDPVRLTLAEFSSRAIYDSGSSLTGRTVVMTGFVTDGASDGSWYLTRLTVTCCAADATTGKVEIRGADAPPADTWVTVTGTWHPKGRLGSDAAWPPVLGATALKTVRQPSDPYETR